MKNFQKINKQEYRDLLDKTSFKTFFHEIEWHEFLEKEFKWLKFEYYSYKNEALLPLARFKVFGKEKLISLPFCEYGGPLPYIYINDFERDALAEFKNIKIKIHPRISGISGNPRASSNLSSHWLHLENKSKEEIWDSLRKTLRHEIKNAQEHNLEIKKCLNESELKHFYNLYVANLKRKKTIPYPFSVIKFLYKNPATEILLAIYKGKIIAGELFLHYGSPRCEAGKFVHYFLSASDYKYRDFSASHLLLWEKIKSLIGKDIILDLGATPKGSSLDIFKSGWGGKEYPILQLGIQRNQENLRLSKLRKILGLLPSFIIKKLSPILIKYRL